MTDSMLYTMAGFVVGLLVGITFTAGTLILAVTAKPKAAFDGCKACLHEGPYDGDAVCRERGCGCVCLGG